MYTTKKCVLTIALMGFVVCPAGAALVFEQTPPNTTLNGIYSYSDPAGIADNFTLPMDSWITSATWFGYYADAALAPSSMDFLVRFYSDGAGLPDSILYEDTLTTSVADSGLVVAVSGGSPYDGRTVYEFTASLASPVVVSAGDNTWLSIVESSTGNPHWFWSRYDNTFQGLAYQNLEGAWVLSNGNLAFSLDGAIVDDATTVIPAPGAVLLGSIGIGCVSWLRRRRTL